MTGAECGERLKLNRSLPRGVCSLGEKTPKGGLRRRERFPAAVFGQAREMPRPVCFGGWCLSYPSTGAASTSSAFPGCATYQSRTAGFFRVISNFLFWLKNVPLLDLLFSPFDALLTPQPGGRPKTAGWLDGQQLGSLS